ncbi:hypothetical protein GGI07_004868 [Coemansia sp. Benny D115]|nr:hypothetical protein GGI07_004868 [Coemansia sp. Benny D115]
MSGPTKPFDPFGRTSALAGAGTASHTSDPSAVADSLADSLAASAAGSSSVSPTATHTSSAEGNNSSATATATAAGASQVAADALPKHTSIFELGGEPFSGEQSASAGAPALRLRRIVSSAAGSSTPLSSTTSPLGGHRLGPIMGSPHILFNDSPSYGVSGQSQLPMQGARGNHASTGPQISHPQAHRLPQSRFNNMLGDAAAPAPPAHGVLDTSTSMLDTIKSQQASPSNANQAGGFDFYVKSLPVSRRNSREFQNLWQELEGFSINDSTTHPSINMPAALQSQYAGIDGHAIAAMNSSGAFRGDAGSAAALGTSPKLPHGLLDDEVLTIQPKKTAASAAAGTEGMANGTARNPPPKLGGMGSAIDLASSTLYGDSAKRSGTFSMNKPAFAAYSRDPRLDALGSANAEQLAGDTISDLRMYDHNRGINLIRNASTPVLNAKQYQAAQAGDEISLNHAGPIRGGNLVGTAFADVGAAARYDQQALMFKTQQQQQQHSHAGYAMGLGDMAYDMAGGRHHQGAAGPNYGGAFSSNAPVMGIGRTQSFVVNASASGANTPIGLANGYGMQGPFGAAAGGYGLGGGMQPAGHLSVPPTPMQHVHHGASHIHMHSQPQQPPQPQQSQQQQQSHQSQRHSHHHHHHQQNQQSQQQPQQQQQPQANGAKAASSGSGQSASAASGNGSSAGQQANQSSGVSGGQASHHQKHGHNTGKNARRSENETNKFVNVSLEELQGTIFDVCKDQYGCRFLQKKLEEGQSDQIDIIFKEASPHFSELMIDPFGNYLCQKLLEHCAEPQRKQIIAGVAPDLVNISLNMHGTRAVQKMIESLTHQEQIGGIVEALRKNVVLLIRDLNGNHVIQKCLSKLSPKNNQFIYDSVAASCTDVATHRHGCCVFQRCIDHATNKQKEQLVAVIIEEALTLVQDPFGNYVVQYVLDLGVSEFSEPLIRRFVDHICGLSVQKFSSNVMEKCIRIASAETRKMLIAPLLQREKLEMLMRDSYGNYVVQTALDFADQNQRMDIIEAILPLLPLIRQTPYGKRIYIKLQRDGFVSAVPSAAASRHASPTLGPSHGTHASAAVATMPLYSQLANTAMGGQMPAAMAAGSALSRGVSPLNGVSMGSAGGKPPVGSSRMYLANTSGAGGGASNSVVYHHNHHHHHHGVLPPSHHHPLHQPAATGSVYYYNMAGVDGAALGQQQSQQLQQQQQQQQHMYSGIISGGNLGQMMPANSNGLFDQQQQRSSAIAASGPAPLSAPLISAASQSVAAVSGPPGAKLQTTSYYGAR